MSSQLFAFVPSANRPAGKEQVEWWPVKGELQADGTVLLKIDSELELDASNIFINNLKVGSTDQTKTNVRFLKVLDDGTVVVVSKPTDLYKITDIDDVNPVKYYGFTDVLGGWYILKEDLSVTPNTYRYAVGSSDYPNSWTNRATQSYDYFYNKF